MARITKGNALGRAVSKRETKVCALCGALNYRRNTECLTCGWRGVFEYDGAAIDYHWQELIQRYEEVRLEHLVPRGVGAIDEFGKVRLINGPQHLFAAWVRCWQTFLARRDARCAEREAALRSKSPLPPR